MKLVLSEFLRTLKERDEFDRLLPDLLLSMSYVPLSKPQTGVRQHGVDLAVAGVSADDGQQELLLFVIKRGDIGRREWDNPEPTCVRTSLNEALDVYLNKFILPEHANVRKKLIVATTGDMKQDVEPNWVAFKEMNTSRALFEFWGSEKLADLIERHMLNENLFVADDRADLRKALALAGENEYDFRDLKRLFMRQLGLNQDGTCRDSAVKMATLQKTLRRVHLAAQICASWARNEGDTRQALWIAERALQWSWHRLLLVNAEEQPRLYSHISDLWTSYLQAGADYIEAIGPHLALPDAMAVYAAEGAELGMVLFEHIGILGSIGLACALVHDPDPDAKENNQKYITVLADCLCDLLKHNSCAASPPLDEHAIDISLALLFLHASGRVEVAKNWLGHLVQRLDYCLRTKRGFPVGTDRYEDVVALQVEAADDEQLKDALMKTSWCLATLAAWCLVFGMEEEYQLLARGHLEAYSNAVPQLWHPAPDWPSRWHFGGATRGGESEAPYALPTESAHVVKRIQEFLANPKYDWPIKSPARLAGLWPLDFIACRHFRMPVPASAWYRLAFNQATAADPCSLQPTEQENTSEATGRR